MAITTNKKTADKFDVVVRTGKFPTQGKKVVLTKGDTKISFPFSDIPNFIATLGDIALAVDPTEYDDAD